MKKAINIVKTLLTWCLVAISVLMMIFTVLTVTAVDKVDKDLFGVRFYIVLSDSMRGKTEDPENHPHYFSAGDMVISVKTDPSELKEGDVITFRRVESGSDGKLQEVIITHKIRKVTSKTLENGTTTYTFTTYGTTTGVDDESKVMNGDVLGKYVGHVPYLGRFFEFLKTTPGYICCILIPFLLLILSQAINSIKLFRQYKREQLAEIQAKQAAIDAEREAERAENKRMMEELLALRAQMTASAAPPVSQPVAQAAAPTEIPPVVPNPAPENPVSENPVSENFASENFASENFASENFASENSASEKPASEKATDAKADLVPEADIVPENEEVSETSSEETEKDASEDGTDSSDSE